MSENGEERPQDGEESSPPVLEIRVPMKTKTLDEVFADDLRDPDFVREYLQVALEENGPEGLAIAMRRVLSTRPESAETRAASGDSVAGFQAFYRQ